MAGNLPDLVRASAVHRMYLVNLTFKTLCKMTPKFAHLYAAYLEHMISHVSCIRQRTFVDNFIDTKCFSSMGRIALWGSPDGAWCYHKVSDAAGGFHLLPDAASLDAAA